MFLQMVEHTIPYVPIPTVKIKCAFYTTTSKQLYLKQTKENKKEKRKKNSTTKN